MKDDEMKDLVGSRILRWILIGLGTIMVILGVIGIFLPILPTTPFLLLAAFMYARGSKRFYRWLLTNRLFGSYLKNYREKRGIPLKVKIFIILLLWTTISISALVFVSDLFIRGILFLIAVIVTIHLIWIKTLKTEDKDL